MIKTGAILKSKSILQDDYFCNARIIIVEANSNGICGLMLHKKHPRRLNELIEFKDCLPIPLCEGGPVEQEKLFFLHRKPELIPGGVLLSNNIFFGGDFKQAVAMLNMGIINESDIKLFTGYCGWDTEQLNTEIQNGDWAI